MEYGTIVSVFSCYRNTENRFGFDSVFYSTFHSLSLSPLHLLEFSNSTQLSTQQTRRMRFILTVYVYMNTIRLIKCH